MNQYPEILKPFYENKKKKEFLEDLKKKINENVKRIQKQLPNNVEIVEDFFFDTETKKINLE